MSTSADVDRWIADLTAAGWVEVQRNIWKAPNGALFRGPYGAWCALHLTGMDW